MIRKLILDWLQALPEASYKPLWDWCVRNRQEIYRLQVDFAELSKRLDTLEKTQKRRKK